MSTLRVGRWTVKWAVHGEGLEEESGDLHVVAPFVGGVLIATIDGLGHGPEAARAARTIARVLESNPAEPLPDLVERCHAQARSTRGAVLTLAAFRADESELSWCGIGNVEGRLFRGKGAFSSGDLGTSTSQNEAVAARGGVVGYQIPRVRVSTLAVCSGDTLVLATDGIKSGFEKLVRADFSPSQIASDIFAGCGRGTDDALVTVVRFLGGST